MELTNVCNLKCDFCPITHQTRKRTFMETELAKDIISEIAEHHLSDYISFHIMGEPLLHKDVLELCHFAKEQGLSAVLFTNGVLLNEELNTKLLATGLDRLEVSFRTPNELAFIQKSSSSSLTFEAYKDKVKGLISSKLESDSHTEIRIHFFKKSKFFDSFCPVDTRYLTNSQENLSIMNEFQMHCLTMAKRLGKDISKYQAVSLSPSRDAVEIFDRISLCCERLNSFYLNESSRYSSYSKAFFGSCDTFRNQSDFGILANGDVTTCCLDYNGENAIDNVRNKKLIDILEMDQVKSIIKHFNHYHPPTDLCRRCLGSPNVLFSFGKQAYSIFQSLAKNIKKGRD